MIEDVLWKIFRKSLSGKLYERLRKSKLGRPYNYLSLQTYRDIFVRYQKQKNYYRGKTVLELGSGFQFFTAFYFLSDGASKVILVDPIFENKDVKKTIKMHYIEFSKYHKLDENMISRIEVFTSFGKLIHDYNNQIDCIFSHFVLEHLENLESYFDEVYRLLPNGGICYSFVDLSDHTYHLFDSRKLTRWVYRTRMLYHLRYSDSFYRLISDKRTWQNRLLFPVYTKLALNKGFVIVSYKCSKCKKTKIHKDILNRSSNPTDDNIYTTHFSLLLQKK